jgi:hypothetical protein
MALQEASIGEIVEDELIFLHCRAFAKLQAEQEQGKRRQAPGYSLQITRTPRSS